MHYLTVIVTDFITWR